MGLVGRLATAGHRTCCSATIAPVYRRRMEKHSLDHGATLIAVPPALRRPVGTKAWRQLQWTTCETGWRYSIVRGSSSCCSCSTSSDLCCSLLACCSCGRTTTQSACQTFPRSGSCRHDDCCRRLSVASFASCSRSTWAASTSCYAMIQCLLTHCCKSHSPCSLPPVMTVAVVLD